MSKHRANEGKKPVDNHLQVSASEALRKHKQMEKSEVSKKLEWLKVSEEDNVPQEALVGPQETQCPSVREPGSFQDYRTAHSEGAYRS